ncbi:MAG: sigma 54-interacting transcriptional regulator [Desulfohalobiaceae bacterium]
MSQDQNGSNGDSGSEAQIDPQECQQILLRAPEGIFKSTPEGRPLFANPAFARMFGYNSVKEMLESVLDISRQLYADPEDRQELLRLLQEQGQVVDYECCMMRKDGSQFWASFSVETVRDQEGRALHYYAFVSEVTRRKLGERRLEEEFNLRNALLDNIPHCVALILKKGTREIVASNRAGQEIGAVPGKTCFQTVAFREDPCPFCRAPELWKTGQLQQIEVKYRGTWYQGIWAPLSNDLYVHYIYDITERNKMGEALRESEERFRTLVEGAPDAVFVQTEQRFAYLNPQAVELFGASQESELLGQPVVDRVQSDFREVIMDRMRWLNEDRQPVLERSELKFLRLDGKEVWVETTGQPITYQGKQGALLFVRDISERKKYEQELKKIQGRLKRSQEVARVATWERDLVTDETFWSDEQFRLYGYEPSEDLDKKELIKRHVHPEDMERILYTVQEVLQGKRPYDIQFRFITVQGQERIGHCIGEVERDKNGRPLRIFGTMQDITEQVRMQEALQESREHYQYLLQSSRHSHSFHRIIGRSKQMQHIYVLLQQLAKVDTTVLITGESGTGKEIIAETLHAISHRAHGPLIKVNCVALAEELLESELFGHVKGAFTGAYYHRTGRIEAAEGGTLLLDEIGDIPLRLQLKLLRFLQEKQYEPVGDSKTRKADVRILAATNADLAQKVQEGSFRQDLYYRLKVMPVHVPPLRERREDIPLFIDYFCQHFTASFEKPIKGVSPEALRILLNFSWPGNVRELEHVLEHGALLCPGGGICPEHLPQEILNQEETPLQKKACQLESQDLLKALQSENWNKSAAAKRLGISRRTMYRRLHQFRLL